MYRYLLFTFCCLLANTACAEQKITLFAAASLSNALTEIIAGYEKDKGIKVINAFAATSALARQIENGAPADILISADSKWMDYLQEKKLIQPATRQNFLSNRLVLIAPKDKGFKVDFSKGFDLSKAFVGKLCTGDLEAVPVGIYGKQSLQSLAWWDAIKVRIVGTQDVRAALVLVERGECAAGIVYETDAKVSGKVDMVGIFPDASHEAIVYPIALTVNAKPAAKDLLEYISSEKAAEVFTRYGFSVIKK